MRYIFVYHFLFYICLHAFFYKQHFYKQSQTEIGKKLSKSLRLNLRYLKIIPFFSTTLSPKNSRKCCKKYTKSKYVCLNEVIWLMSMKMRLKMKNRSLRYNINRPRLRHGNKYTKYKMCLSIIMVIWIKQHWD